MTATQADAAAAERAGDWERAARLYDELFQEAVRHRTPERIPASLRAAGRAYRNAERLEEAEELADLSQEIARRLGLPGEEAKSLNLRATLLHRRQDLPGAQRLFLSALDKARGLGDDRLVALTCLNLGVIDHTLGNLREARALYLESVSAGLRSGFAEPAMPAYNNLGMVCTDLGEWLEALLHLDRGIEIAERVGDVAELAILRTNRIEPLIRLGELQAAESASDEAETLARSVANQSALADVARFRGMIAMERGRPEDAASELHAALDITEEYDLELCRAETLEQLALLHRRQGNDERALKTIERSFDAFFEVGARRDVKRVAALLEEWRHEQRQPVRIGRAGASG